jgi:hypothetical protein
MLEAVIALSGEVHRNNFLDRQQVRKRYVAQQNDYTWHTHKNLNWIRTEVLQCCSFCCITTGTESVTEISLGLLEGKAVRKLCLIPIIINDF